MLKVVLGAVTLVLVGLAVYTGKGAYNYLKYMDDFL